MRRSAVHLDLDAEFPSDLAWMLFQPKRYKVGWGGRGATKSWGFGRALLILGSRKRLRILCAREVQNSIAESVHKLLSMQVVMMNMGHFYSVTKTNIVGINGTEIFYSGLRHNVDKVRSFEDIDICWVEEAKSVSKNSWNVLVPTIRKKGSEIWITFNPELNSDETYKRFVLTPPGKIVRRTETIIETTTAIVMFLNWRDNPWFSSEAEEERREMEEKDPDGYLNVWEGHCRVAVEGAIFANELRDATKARRITHVPYDPTVPVHTFWDLGWADYVAIWFIQKVGFEYHVIDYMEDHQKTVAHFYKEMQKKKYIYGTHYLPHDGGNRQLAANGASVRTQVIKAAQSKLVKVLPNLSPTAQINYTRTVFQLCYFDERKCEIGLERLRRFKFLVDEETGEREGHYLHDINSHGASAFLKFGVSVKHIDKPKKTASDEIANAIKKARGTPTHPEFGDLVNEGAGLGWMNG